MSSLFNCVAKIMKYIIIGITAIFGLSVIQDIKLNSEENKKK